MLKIIERIKLKSVTRKVHLICGTEKVNFFSQPSISVVGVVPTLQEEQTRNHVLIASRDKIIFFLEMAHNGSGGPTQHLSQRISGAKQPGPETITYFHPISRIRKNGATPTLF
jgi:hypothetical protein